MLLDAGVTSSRNSRSPGRKGTDFSHAYVSRGVAPTGTIDTFRPPRARQRVNRVGGTDHAQNCLPSARVPGEKSDQGQVCTRLRKTGETTTFEGSNRRVDPPSRRQDRRWGRRDRDDPTDSRPRPRTRSCGARSGSPSCSPPRSRGGCTRTWPGVSRIRRVRAVSGCSLRSPASSS